MGLNPGCTCLIRLHEFLITLSVKDGDFRDRLLCSCPKTRYGGLLSCITHLPVDHLLVPYRPCVYYQQIKNVTISLRFGGATLIHAAMILLWIKASIKWKNEPLFMCYMKFLCPTISHTHKLAVERYSSYLDEILAVLKSSLLAGSASPLLSSPSTSSLPCCTALSTFSHPDRCFSHLGLKMRQR